MNINLSQNAATSSLCTILRFKKKAQLHSLSKIEYETITNKKWRPRYQQYNLSTCQQFCFKCKITVSVPDRKSMQFNLINIIYDKMAYQSSSPISAHCLVIFFLKGISKSSKSTSHPYRSRLTCRCSISSLLLGCLVHGTRGVYVMSSCSSMPPAKAEAALRMDPFLCRGGWSSNSPNPRGPEWE